MYVGEAVVIRRLSLNALVVYSIPSRGNDYALNIFYFSALVKKGLEFRHPTRNVSRIEKKSESEIEKLCPYL